MLLNGMAGTRRLTKDRLAGFSRQLKTLIDKAQDLRDEINRSLIAATPPPAADGSRRRTSRSRLKR
jgi:uncharacterized coiled-coil protein SlyX